MQIIEKLKNAIAILSALLVHGFLLMIPIVYFYPQFPYSVVFAIYYLNYPGMISLLFLDVLFMSTIVGFIQYLSTRYVWRRNIARNWFLILGSGVCLTTILEPLLVTVYLFLADFYSHYYSIRYVLAYFLIIGYIFLFGFIGWIFTKLFREVVVERKKLPVTKRPRFEEGTRSVCNRCGASYHYRKRDISENGLVRCFNCGKEFMISSTEKLLEKLERSDTSGEQYT